ncbi:type III-B CRISPR-associated protein Cas10/Cmr2 [Halanaerobium salsuginis]|jgi:CRISPR-associated protein Cmr2|uniref:CRISPR-associated protein Cas10/Cmr2, subtype III-B n=1 Tax=Halanaerobium salsuginis TaxID=29563 RepID=A0A1I4M1W1_9FIRM|nr:type III-B CRISPR-associated protein Cas10/Cmr2 [Halanaerobium salsuginis]SFL97378.1 CRISPR-associated protein Cas10/Cmr2, subtype III-B [Halanaerobium salsuginis]
MKYIIAVNIRSVQDYISKARKVLDLSNSSKIFSNMMYSFISELNEKTKNLDVIYPAVDLAVIENNKQDYSNYLLSVFNYEGDIRLLIADLETAVYTNLASDYKGNITFALLKGYLVSCDNYFQGIEQLFKDQFKMNIVVKELKSEKKYYDSYVEVTKAINNLKNSYDFNQLSVLEGLKNKVNKSRKKLKKCHICGEYTTRYVREDSKHKNLDYVNYINSVDKLLKKDEALCDVCFYKRIKDYENKDTPSTYDIATNYFRAKMYKIRKGNANIDDLLKELDSKINDEIIDSKYCYQKNIFNLEKRIKSGELVVSNTNRILKKIEDLKTILKKAKEKEIIPASQYALVQLDIDNLGEWMRGNYFKEDQSSLIHNQRNLSKVIIKFSQDIKKEFNNELLGHVVYAGGDDFLAFLPVEKILEAVKMIKEKFSALKSYDKLSYSIVITLADVQIPLTMVIKKTREELERVKEKYKSNYTANEKPKDGFVINNMVNRNKYINSYLKNSEVQKYIEIYQALVDLIKDKNNSLSFIKNIQQEFNKFEFLDLNIDEKDNFLKIFDLESARIIKRSLSNLDIKEAKNSFKTIKNINHDLFISQINKIASNSYNIDFENYINLLTNLEKLLKYRMLQEGKNVTS